MTLKLDLRSHASRNTTRQTRRRSSDAYDKVDPAGNGGGAVLQPYAEGYFSSPNNFVLTGNDGTTSPQATSEASITLQILSVATASTEAINQQTPGGADSNVTASHRAAPAAASTAPHLAHRGSVPHHKRFRQLARNRTLKGRTCGLAFLQRWMWPIRQQL